MIKHAIFYIALFTAIMISSCSNNERNYSINGTVNPEKNGDYIMLFKYRGDSIYAVDSTNISEGTFKFSGEETLHDIAIITTGNYPDIVRAAEVVLERGEIEVYLDSISEVKGTPLNELYTAFKRKKSDSWAKYILWEQQNKDSIAADKELIWRKYALYQKNLADFYKENIKNPVGRRTFKECKRLENKDIYQIYELLPEEYKSDPVIADRIKRCEEEDKKNDLRGQLIGQKYTDFELFTQDKSTKKLSDYVGKSEFLLIDFWGSYCSPCIRKVPKRKAIYDKYKDRGFQIISISFDNRLEQWQEVINKVDAPWIHLSDLKGGKSPLKETYHIPCVPYSILLDKEGTIIDVLVQESILKEILEKSLGEV